MDLQTLVTTTRAPQTPHCLAQTARNLHGIEVGSSEETDRVGYRLEDRHFAIPFGRHVITRGLSATLT